MAGIFALSIRPGVYDCDFPGNLFWGTFYQQHLGEEYAGTAVFNNGAIANQSYPGLFRSNFYRRLETLEGTEAMGYCGSQPEPFFRQTKLGKIAVCFSGNVLNRSRLAEELMLLGHTFERGDDIEIIVKLLSQGKDVIDGIVRMNEKVQGSYALLVLSEQGLYAASFSGHWPLVIGEKKRRFGRSHRPFGIQESGFQNRQGFGAWRNSSAEKRDLPDEKHHPSESEPHLQFFMGLYGFSDRFVQRNSGFPYQEKIGSRFG
jgi:glutamine phosphoribosylpyrophosphate amidotransferase